MNFFEKRTRIYLKNNVLLKKYYILGIPIGEKLIKTENGKDQIIAKGFSLMKKMKKSSNPPFYLKVNRLTVDSYMYIQKWVNIAGKYDTDIYFVCDKKQLKNNILKKIDFTPVNRFEFIKSCKNTINKEIDLKNISSTVWYNAGYSHYTTYFHARKNNIHSFWNIDADDTMFFEKNSYIADLMKKLSDYAEENNKEVMTLDMHVSASNSRSWTYGVTFVRNPENFIEKSKTVKNFDWVQRYKEMTWGQSNIDLFTQYLKDSGDNTIGTFYFDNTHFVHMAGHLVDPRHLFYYWKDNTLYMPIILYFFNDEKVGKLPVSNDCVKITSDLKYDNYIDYSFLFTFDVYLRPDDIYNHYLKTREEKIEK